MFYKLSPQAVHVLPNNLGKWFLHTWHVPREAHEGPHGADEGVEQDGERSGHGDLEYTNYRSTRTSKWALGL